MTDGEAAPVKIERIVPMYPLSQDRLRYNRLIKILSLYRLTLGQPRQEELIEIISREIAGQIDNQQLVKSMYSPGADILKCKLQMLIGSCLIITLKEVILGLRFVCQGKAERQMIQPEVWSSP